MPRGIKDPDADRLARTLAQRTGETRSFLAADVVQFAEHAIAGQAAMLE